LGKYGTFHANQILGRPYHLTFEIAEKMEGKGGKLRIVSATELHTEYLIEETSTPSDSLDGEFVKDGGTPDIDAVVGEVLRTNRETIDDPSRQTMTMEEIEALKRDATGTGKEIVEKILQSHTALDQKTAFSLAKYTMRKRQKYLRRFTVLPLDVLALTQYLMTEKDPSKIMEIREEMLGLISCWANVHYGGCDTEKEESSFGQGRWLAVDETGGLIVAAMAERMGILYPPEEPELDSDVAMEPLEPQLEPPRSRDDRVFGEENNSSGRPNSTAHDLNIPPQDPTSNTITLIHPNTQPNLSLLSHFSFSSGNPCPSHPLNTHLKTLSWLQLLSPLYTGTTYSEPQPESLPPTTLSALKASKRANYHRKNRRWARMKSVVDETRAGNFDGLVVASFMEPKTILEHLVPLLGGGAQICIYSPNIEPLVELADLYSTARRTGFINSGLSLADLPTEDFPLNPMLLLSATIQTIRARPWQVLPGRTHPRMMGRGGAEGYLFHAVRVIPAEGRVEARGKKGMKSGEGIGTKRRKMEEAGEMEESLAKIVGRTGFAEPEPNSQDVQL
jgi:tRNA (adenine58-N1)-methyltransferase non-catalytic subunit